MSNVKAVFYRSECVLGAPSFKTEVPVKATLFTVVRIVLKGIILREGKNYSLRKIAVDVLNLSQRRGYGEQKL